MITSEIKIYDQIERDLLALPVATSAIEAAALVVLMHYRIIRFRGNAMIKVKNPYEHFMPMDKDTFERAAYPLLGGMTRSQMNHLFAYLCNTVDDLTANDRYILFGAGTKNQTVWDMEKLEVRTDIIPDDCVWRSPYSMKRIGLAQSNKPLPFLLALADGDIGRYSDIMQSLAPIVMAKKPVGVIWWTGDSTNSKLALMEALHKISPGQLSGLSLKQLVGGRSSTPVLNRVLGNIAEDSGLIADTEIYKNIGSHQNFNVHRYHSQQGIEIRGNVHQIFLSGSAPSFYNRSMSADWRTHTVPFRRLEENQVRTLPDNQLGQLATEMCRYAIRIKQQGYCYKWSGADTANKKPATALSPTASALPEFRW